MKKIPLFLTLLLLMSISTVAFSQVKVLINEVVTDVTIKDGQVVKINKTDPDYMKGYTKSPQDPFQKVNPNLNSETNVVAQDVAVTRPAKRVSKQNALEGAAVNFEPASFKIHQESMLVFMSYAEKIKSGHSNSVLLKSWYKMGDAESEKLVTQRLDNCKEIMESQGVASNLILTSLIGSKRQSNFVSIIIQ